MMWLIEPRVVADQEEITLQEKDNRLILMDAHIVAVPETILIIYILIFVLSTGAARSTVLIIKLLINHKFFVL